MGLSPGNMSEEEMRDVASSGSVVRIEEFLRNNPDLVNQYFVPELGDYWTFLGFASYSGDTEIVKYLINLPDIDLRLGIYNADSPLDLALQMNRIECVHALVMCEAPLHNNEQKELDDFLAEFPVFRGKSAQPAISN